MQQLNIPIVHKTYELYRTLHDLQKTIPKMERYTLWQRSENTTIDVLEALLRVGYLAQEKRPDHLIQVSAQVDTLRVFLRLSLDVKAINQKKYIAPTSARRDRPDARRLDEKPQAKVNCDLHCQMKMPKKGGRSSDRRERNIVITVVINVDVSVVIDVEVVVIRVADNNALTVIAHTPQDSPPIDHAH